MSEGEQDQENQRICMEYRRDHSDFFLTAVVRHGEKKIVLSVLSVAYSMLASTRYVDYKDHALTVQHKNATNTRKLSLSLFITFTSLVFIQYIQYYELH